MKLVIISAAAPPEPIVAGRVHWDIATSFAEENYEVWLISPYPSRPLGATYETLKSIRITRVSNNFFHVNINSFTYPQYNLFYRIYESLDFGIKSIRYVNKKIRDYDLIYASSWPFIGQLMILILKKNKKAPLIMNVQDLYPESFFTKINSKFLNWVLRPMFLVDKLIALKSSHVTVVSETLKKVYLTKRKIAESKITTICNWQDESEFVKPIIPKSQILEKYSLSFLKEKFVFMYLGNIGPVAGVETIITAFAGLKIKNAVLVIAGSGSRKVSCQLLSDNLGVRNSFFLEVPQGLIPVVELQSISDVLLLPILPEAANSSIPSKLIAYMFSGKPVITSANQLSETALAIEVSNCGWITPSNNTSDWTDFMRQACETDQKVLQSKGRSGMEFALKNYSKEQGLKKIRELFFKLKES